MRKNIARKLAAILTFVLLFTTFGSDYNSIGVRATTDVDAIEQVDLHQNNETDENSIWEPQDSEQVEAPAEETVEEPAAPEETAPEEVAPPAEETPGAQIDLLIDRADRCVNLCEMKFSRGEYEITKSEREKIENRATQFMQYAEPRKSIRLTMITSFGLKPNTHSSIIQSQLTLDDLFQASLFR